jgi:flagellar assembly protein FliH
MSEPAPGAAAAEPAYRPLEIPVLGTERIDAGFERARVRGHAAGYAAGAAVAAAGLATARAELEAQAARRREAEQARTASAVQALGAAAAVLNARMVDHLGQLTGVLAEAALDLAADLLGSNAAGSGPLGDRARSALDRALAVPTDPPVHTVRLHPEDLEALAGQEAAGVVLVADPALARGDAVAEYDGGWIDARLGEALARARAALRGEEW